MAVTLFRVTDELIGAAMRRIRVAAAEHMDYYDTLSLGWSEEGVTEIAAPRGEPQVRFVPFNRWQESRVGADYLWWWVDEHRETCFGMLVQAKRLTFSGGRLRMDIMHNKGKQLVDLRVSADHFEVPAMYGLYAGGKVFRREHLPCPHDAEFDTCLACARRAVMLVGAWQVLDARDSPIDTAGRLFNFGRSLEDFVDPTMTAGPVPYRQMAEIGSKELKRFLLTEQSGPLEIAKRVLDAVVKQRNGAFQAVLAEPMTLTSTGQLMFPEVPVDRGHFPGAYFGHYLRGVRSTPPEYVQDVLAGRAVPTAVADRIAGIVVVQA